MFRFCFGKYLLVKLEDISVQLIVKLKVDIEIFGVAVEQFKRAEEKVLYEFVADRAAEGTGLQIVEKCLFKSIIILGTSLKSLVLYFDNFRQQKIANNLDILSFSHADCRLGLKNLVEVAFVGLILLNKVFLLC